MNLRTKFTKWYWYKGYTMEWKPCDYADGVAEMIFNCPLWVRPLVYFLFSPSVYYNEVLRDFGEEFETGLKGE